MSKLEIPSILSFSKYEGCGNDFILIDNRDHDFPDENKPLISFLCSLKKGIGADGLILLEKSFTADFKMRIFNADGSEAEMCGNGIRCLVKYVRQLGFSRNSYVIETLQRHLSATVENDQINIQMGKPVEMKWDIDIPLHSKTYKGHYLNTGVPHIVIIVDDIDSINVREDGAKIRYDSQFAPKGVNVNFVQLAEESKCLIRTYERGVEDETLACGTGATAAAIAIVKKFGLKQPVRLHTKSGEILTISFTINKNDIDNVVMCGPANHIFSGSISLTK